MSDTLTPQQERFVEEYVIDYCGKQAAIRAGYKSTNAEVQASRLLTLSKVKTALAATKQEVKDRHDVTIEKVKDEIAKCGFSNMQDYMSVDHKGYPHLDFSKLTREQAAALSEVTVEEYVEGKAEEAKTVKKVKFKLLDKLSALEKLGKHLGMFKEESKGNNYQFNFFDREKAEALAGLSKREKAADAKEV